jgi:single-stranded-DNA-specific exonuclease
LGFVLGPRLNAAGRLQDMSIGIECLITADVVKATELAEQLDALNRGARSRRHARRSAGAPGTIEPGDAFGSLYDPGWHQGVIGILAARIRERFHRPAFAFAPGQPASSRLRSIPTCIARRRTYWINRSPAC